MRRALVSLAFAAVVAAPGAAQATEPRDSITVGTPDCHATVDYEVHPPVVIDLSRPPYVHFVFCPGSCLSLPGAGIHCPI
jgi:hypothetical protein